MKIKSFEHACKVLDIPAERPDVSRLPEQFAARVIAQHELDVICVATDPAFKADYSDWNQDKWYPVHTGSGSGFRLCVVGYANALTGAGLGSRPLPTEKDAKYIGTTFLHLFKVLAGA